MNDMQRRIWHDHAVYGALFGFPLDWANEESVAFWLADVADWRDEGKPLVQRDTN